jgi:tripartite-type tricarboxylate transporter receptor subunit TctC
MKKATLLLVMLLLVLVSCYPAANQSAPAPANSTPPVASAEPAAEAGSLSAPATPADSWPTEPITIIVPQAAGGTTDTFARGISQFLPKYLNVPVAVENVDGGAGIVGLNEFLDRDADGQTIFIFHQAKLSMGHLIDGNDYSLDSFAFITTPQIDYPTITVGKDSPYTTFDELIADIKARPGELAMSITPNSGPQLSGLMLLDRLGLEVRVVSYQSGNDNRLAIAGGHVDFGMSNASGDYTFRDSVTTLSVFSDEPYTYLPDAPPINEALAPYGVEVVTGLGSIRNVLAHTALRDEYPERYERLVKAFEDVCKDEEYLAFLKNTGEDAISEWRNPEDSLALNQGYEAAIIEFRNLMTE